MKKIKFLLVFLFCFSLISCVDFEHVNTFSTTAIKTIQSYSQINYSFTSSYYDYTEGKKLLHLTEQDVSDSRVAIKDLPSNPETLRVAKKADKVINYFINSIVGYFQALSKISGKDIATLNFDDLSKNLKSANDIKLKLNISDKQIDAASNIVKTFSREILGSYTKRKIKEVFVNKDADLSLSVDALVNALENLNNNLKSDSGIIRSDYLKVLLNSNIKETLQKVNLRSKFYNDIGELHKESEKIMLLIAGLNKIKEGHHQIVEKLKNNKITADEVIAVIDKYSTEIFELLEEIKTL